MPIPRVIRFVLLSVACATVSGAATISLPTTFTGTFTGTGASAGIAFRVPAPSTENILQSFTLDFLGSAYQGSGVRVPLDLQAYLREVDPVTKHLVGPLLFSSGLRQLPVVQPLVSQNPFVLNPNVALDPARTYVLYYEFPGNLLDSIVQITLSSTYDPNAFSVGVGAPPVSATAPVQFYPNSFAFTAVFVSGAAAAIPEPGTYGLLIAGFAAMLVRRRALGQG